jgi:ankyrin repeat protein
MAKQLIKAGADVNLRDRHERSPIAHALYEKHGSIVSLLAAAVQGDNRDLVQMLIGLGSDINAISKYGESVLDLAKRAKKDPAIVELLASHGAVSTKAESEH